MASGPPTIFPALPINIPGNQGTVTLVGGVYQNTFVQQTINPALVQQQKAPIGPPFVTPPTQFETGVPATSPAEFTPASLPNLALWLDANVGITLVGGVVSSWVDQSGVGVAHNLTQAVAGKRPSYNAVDATYNGNATLSFTAGAGQFMQSGVWADPMNQPTTIFVVGNNNGGNNQVFLDDLGPDHQQISVLFNDYSMRAGAVLTSSAATASPVVVGGIFNGATSKIFVTSTTPAASGDVGAFGATGTTIGISGDGVSNALAGKIASVVIVHGVMSDANIAALFNYFQNRYHV